MIRRFREEATSVLADFHAGLSWLNRNLVEMLAFALTTTLSLLSQI